ncbi:uncharacterized protein LOC117487638 isoform X2 [Trematomus bernacchii]|uniref:uncharacterized protein LOC117487638 isoform X2 n=1 Tax=Trematomus bernacchii TaxID=40690 RepID=UPI00146CE74F|nr:uncharacterized protein LOC117487638 isoform X2 [Trematomus bernacchii]
MSEFRRIIMSSFLMLLLHFPAAEMKHYSRIVRAGDEVTLPFTNVIHDQDKCDSTTWYVSYAPNTPAVTLFEGGTILNEAKAKSDRLRVTEKCSLVIKKVTEEDAGLYLCRQFRSGKQQGPTSWVYLSVVTMTEHQDNDEVTLNCSVLSYGRCIHTVEWLYEDQNVVKDNRDIQTSRTDCSAAVTFSSSSKEKPIYRGLFKCQVMYTYNEIKQLFTFSPPQPPGNDEMTTTSEQETMSSSEETTKTASENNNNQSEQDGKHPGWWWWIIVVTVGVAALTIITVAVIRRKRTQGNETQTDDNVADPEDGASYASISYTWKSSRKARAHDDDEDGEVTYSTVRAPSSSSAASTHSSLLYATVNKPKK